jgi:hypothetical protein
MSVNSLRPCEFPFKNFSSWPQLSYALENLAISIGTIITAFADCILTLYLWIPLGLTRSLIQNIINPLLWFLTSQPQPGYEAEIIAPRVIVISGASSGIGASLVKTYAGPNNILVLLARNPARLNQVAKMARTAGSKAVETHSIDYSHDDAETSIKQVIQGAHQKYGSIDLAISNAGTATFTDDNPHGPEPWGEKVDSCLCVLSQLEYPNNLTRILHFVLIGCTENHKNQRDLNLRVHYDRLGADEEATLGRCK